MSDGDNSDFLDDAKAYEDEQSDVFSGLSRRGSESYNQPPEELNLRKQDSGAKNPNMVVDLKTRLRKTTSESSEPMRPHHEMPIPPPPMYNPPMSNPIPPQQEVEHSGKPIVEIGMRLKSIYPQRYFIFKNMKPQHFKFCKENNYGITQKTNENTLKSAFENSENLLIIFSNTEQRSFLGYARMESDYFDAPEMIDNFTKSSGLTRVDFDNNFIFRIEWKTKNTVRYEFVSHIKNKYNENREVNHSKVFQEVDPNAGKALIALLENPPTEPIAEHETEHKREDQPPMPFHKAPKTEGNFPPNNFMMNNPMMPPHFGYYPMNPMNPMGQMGGAIGGMNPMGGAAGMFPMPGQPGMMGMPKQFPYNMNYNDYYMNMQQQQQQQMMKPNKDKGRKKSASSSGSSSRSSSGSSRSSSPKKGSVKGGRRDSKSASRSRSKSRKRQNKVEKRGGGNYQKGGRKYENNYNNNNNNSNNNNYPNNNRKNFQKFDNNNNKNNNNKNFRGGNRRRNSRSISPNRNNNNNNNNNNKNRFNNRRRSNSRSEENRRRNAPEDHHKEENFESLQPEREIHQQTQSPVVQRERSLSIQHDEDPFDFGEMEDRISEGGNDVKVEQERQESPHAFDEDIRANKGRSLSRSNKRSGSPSSSKSVTESKSTTTKNPDTDFRDQRKKKFSREDEPLVITKGNSKIIGGKGGTERLIIGKPPKYSKQRSPDRSERHERHDRHERFDRHDSRNHRNDRNDRNDRRRSRDRERNASSKKSRERDVSRDRRDSERDRRDNSQRDRREDNRERREEKREEPKERRDEGHESKPKETPRRDRELERSMETSESKAKRIDLRERLSQKDALAAGSITNRIIKKN